jgi:hypothetical protein
VTGRTTSSNVRLETITARLQLSAAASTRRMGAECLPPIITPAV